jgi:hypothetical protein
MEFQIIWWCQDLSINLIANLLWEFGEKWRLLLIAGSLVTTSIARWQWQRQGPFADSWEGARTVAPAPAPLNNISALSALSRKTPWPFHDDVGVIDLGGGWGERIRRGILNLLCARL